VLGGFVIPSFLTLYGSGRPILSANRLTPSAVLYRLIVNSSAGIPLAFGTTSLGEALA
jgi:hypothetical protein